MVTGGMPWRLERNVVKNMGDLIAANYVIPDNMGISPGTYPTNCQHFSHVVGRMQIIDQDDAERHQNTCIDDCCSPTSVGQHGL